MCKWRHLRLMVALLIFSFSATGQDCKANYGWQHNSTALIYYFTDSSKAASGDNIISRYWSWGDGSSTQGNITNPSHTFPRDSVYNVCLKITTQTGCYSYSCKMIGVGSAGQNCYAYYGWQHATNNPREFHFYDSSKTASGDSIVQRLWFWGDGTSTDGNQKNPTHVFSHDSTYDVCERISTLTGCYAYSCQKITVVTTNTTCIANYGWQRSSNSSEYHFYDSSKAAPGDSIINRIWSWGDGTLTDGNLKNPSHAFHHDSTYNVCLKIITQKGCYSYSCKSITIGTNGDCVAYFIWEKYSSAPFAFRFFDTSRAIAGDIIISRQWSWDDGSPLLTGNEKYPAHVFPGPGTYEICLAIKTQKGCEKRICKPLVILAGTSCHAEFIETIVSSTNPSAYVAKFDSHNSSPASDIVERFWTFGDSSSLGGNIVDPSHTYKEPGTYKVCLRIKTVGNCVSEACKEVTIPKRHCEAVFKWEPVPGSISNPQKSFIKFFSGQSHGSDTKDTVIGRKWVFGDGSTASGNDKEVIHGYEKAGSYFVCLYIKTAGGCYDSVCKTIQVPNPPTTHCIPGFSWKADGFKTAFNSNLMVVEPGDSVVLRYWSFGDGTTLPGNNIEALHIYQQPGQYQVCLKIKTKLGCEQALCKMIIVGNTNQHCGALFSYENTGTKKLQFNSTTSYSQLTNDYIIKRYWSFGDGATLGGNEISPLHEYRMAGTYTACLNIVTKENCESKWCHQVKVDGNTWSDSENIKLLNIYPNPVHNSLFVIIWSSHNNVQTQLAIYDVYGILKWSQQVILPQGMSVWPVPTGNLLSGPYIFRLTTQYGVHHKNFQKLN